MKYIKLFFGFVGWLFCILLSVSVLLALSSERSPTIATVCVLLMLVSPFIAAIIVWYRHKTSKGKAAAIQETNVADHRNFLRRRFTERERLMDAVDRHRSALTRNLDRSIKTNDYGAIISDDTAAALSEFFASIALDHDVIDFDEASALVLEQLEYKRSQDQSVGFDPASLPFDGYDFESWVAQSLIAFEWDATVTPASGDQGIDVIAVKDGLRLGIQCKLYSSPIGNKAVQEAHAGKVFHGLDHAAVLTNAGFTTSAKDLAQATGVLLLSHHDIPQLDAKFH